MHANTRENPEMAEGRLMPSLSVKPAVATAKVMPEFGSQLLLGDRTCDNRNRARLVFQAEEIIG